MSEVKCTARGVGGVECGFCSVMSSQLGAYIIKQRVLPSIVLSRVCNSVIQHGRGGMSASQKEIVLAYRHLYQHLLRAVQYSKPARYVVRDQLRNAFRKPTSEPYNPAVISNTLLFLDNAAKSKGLEHRILKNLVHVHWGRQKVKAVDG